jgi:hypothetical protein
MRIRQLSAERNAKTRVKSGKFPGSLFAESSRSEVEAGVSVCDVATPRSMSILVLPIESVDQRYFAWILAETASAVRDKGASTRRS